MEVLHLATRVFLAGNDMDTFKIDVYRGPQTAVSGLPFAVCGMPPSCIKSRVITTRGNMLDFNVVQQLSFKPCKNKTVVLFIYFKFI